MDTSPQITIKALTPALRNDYLEYFDHAAFADNPSWSFCYCCFPHFPHERENWDGRSVAQNRALAAERIDDGRQQGYLAFVDGKVAGWCNANRRDSYTIYDPPTAETPGPMGVIACFIVARPYRRQGVARQLLDAALDGFVAQGVKTVDAYPLRVAHSEAENYHGPLDLYLQAGFQMMGETNNVVWVRRQL